MFLNFFDNVLYYTTVNVCIDNESSTSNSMNSLQQCMIVQFNPAIPDPRVTEIRQ